MNVIIGRGKAPVFADRIHDLHAQMERKTNSGLHHPRVEEDIVQAQFLHIFRHRFKAAYKASLAKLQDYINNLATATSFHRQLKGLDPRNIRDVGAP